MTLEMPNGPPDPTKVYQIKTHGGLGDIVWAVGKKLQSLDRPIFLHISEENRARPRRSGILADHLPNVAGWRFDTTTFCPGGQDWGPPTDPACAIGRTWSQVRPKDGEILRLECNKHLESGKALSDWLPDLETTHHFEFRPCETPARIKLDKPYVLFHLAGWPDVPDPIWVRLAAMVHHLVSIYVIGGTYDARPARLYGQIRHLSNTGLLQDLTWPDMLTTLQGAEYCFGHASGFTALADVLRVPGVVNNPQQHPKLLGTWNSPHHPAQVHCRGAQFQEYVADAMIALASRPAGVWPPDAARVPGIRTKATDPVGVVYDATRALDPTTALVVLGPTAPPEFAAAAINAALDAGRLLRQVTLVGAESAHLEAVYKAAARTTRPPVIVQVASPGDADQAGCSICWAEGDLVSATQAAREAWRRTLSMGSIVLLGPAAAGVSTSLGRSLKTTMCPITDYPSGFTLTRTV